MENQWRHRKKKITGEDEFRYYKFLVDLCSSDEVSYTQNELLYEARKEFKKYNINQSEISRDLDYLNIKKVRKSNVTNEGYVFKYKKNNSDIDIPLDTVKNISGYRGLFKSYRGLKISVKQGYETAICSIIDEKFSSKNVIIIPAYKAVCIITNSGNEALLRDIQRSIANAKEVLKSSTL